LDERGSMTLVYISTGSEYLSSVVKKRDRQADRKRAERKIEIRQRECADIYNAILQANFCDWMREMEAEGFSPKFVRIRPLTVEEIRIAEWDMPSEFRKDGHQVVRSS
jgi:hypothetical protein